MISGLVPTIVMIFRRGGDGGRDFRRDCFVAPPAAGLLAMTGLAAFAVAAEPTPPRDCFVASLLAVTGFREPLSLRAPAEREAIPPLTFDCLAMQHLAKVGIRVLPVEDLGGPE